MDRLSEYQRKRDFDRTREPAGSSVRKGRRRSLRFVIQKHAASHLHFDLRLELDGVMKSWAVPRGPSLDPANRRLAMHVEDHPIEYNTFEGTIPKGEYGGGTVMLWDRGTYVPDEPRPGEAEADAVRRGLKAGKLSFSLHGERLLGSFALIRTGGRGGAGSPRQWLLIKHRDEHATSGPDATDVFITSVETGRTMDEIARAAGGGEGGGAGSEAGDEMMVPMRATPARGLPESGAWTFEPWRGGVRVLAWAATDGTAMVDEAGRGVGGYPEIAGELADLARRLGGPVVLEGEIAADDDGGEAFFVADILLAGEEVLAPRPWVERRAALEEVLKRRRLNRVRRPENDADPARILERAAAAGWPGMLARRQDGPYQPSEQTDALLRITG